MEDVLFEWVLTGASILIVFTALSVIVMSVPCLATRIYNEDAEEVEEVKDLAVEEKQTTTYTEMAGAASLSKKDGSIEMTPLASSKE